MTDIKAIAATYAARIFDRMEMCRGSAILKSDIEREVEMALQDHLASIKPRERLEGDVYSVEHQLINPPAGPVYGVSPATGALSGMRGQLKAISERSVNPPDLSKRVRWLHLESGETKDFETMEEADEFLKTRKAEGTLPPIPPGIPSLEEMKRFWADLAEVIKPQEITVEEAEKRGIPIGAPGYVWVA